MLAPLPQSLAAPCLPTDAIFPGVGCRSCTARVASGFWCVEFRGGGSWSPREEHRLGLVLPGARGGGLHRAWAIASRAINVMLRFIRDMMVPIVDATW